MPRREAPLTEAEAAALVEYRQRYLGYGICTDPADRSRAEAAFGAAYRCIGRDPVPVIWVDSPLTASLAIAVLTRIAKEDLRASLRDSLEASLGASLRASLGDSLRDSLGDSLRASLGASLGDSLWGSLRA
ncbi:MAG: hypothetical protein M0Z36_06610, partial [Thermaerobacter sp.]|nr:hypothetical protein [Thermaerobacter sp.]